MKKIVFICIILDGLSCSALYAKDLENQLHQTCQEKLSLITRADTKGLLAKIMACSQKIKALEARTGKTALHDGQAQLMNSMCQGNQSWCALAEKFKEFDVARSKQCPTMRCQILRLYQQLCSDTMELAKLLKSQHSRLCELNENILTLQKQIRAAGKASTLADEYPHRLFLS